MSIKLLGLFIFIPLLELVLLIKIGEYIGVVWTILLVGSTGAVGISLARWQGLEVIGKLKSNLQQKQLPHNNLLDGILLLVGAATLLTPGLITDLLGFSLIIPVSRRRIRTLVKKKLKAKVNFRSYYPGAGETESEAESSADKTEEEEEIIDIEDYEELE